MYVIILIYSNIETVVLLIFHLVTRDVIFHLSHHFLNNYRLKVAFHIGVWLVLIVVYAWLFLPLYGDLGISLLRGLGNLLPMAFLFYVNLWLVERYFEKNHYVQFLLWATLLMLGIAALRINLNGFFPSKNGSETSYARSPVRRLTSSCPKV